ncbi:hypothetical protein GCM10025331_55170 [Actinoplanes utahensis]|nr:hypothetical protein Aut01nite_61820 [Actinoplanes utahensis]
MPGQYTTLTIRSDLRGVSTPTPATTSARIPDPRRTSGPQVAAAQLPGRRELPPAADNRTVPADGPPRRRLLITSRRYGLVSGHRGSAMVSANILRVEEKTT